MTDEDILNDEDFRNEWEGLRQDLIRAISDLESELIRYGLDAKALVAPLLEVTESLRDPDGDDEIQAAAVAAGFVTMKNIDALIASSSATSKAGKSAVEDALDVFAERFVD